MELLKDMLGVIAPLVGVWLGALLSQGSSRREKLMELRRPAYGVILSHLAKVVRRLDFAAGSIAESATRYFNDENSGMTRDDEFIGHNMSAARARFEDDYLILPDEFIARFETMHAEIAGAEYETTPTAHSIFDKAVRSAYSDLLVMARKEVTGALTSRLQRLTSRKGGRSKSQTGLAP